MAQQTASSEHRIMIAGFGGQGVLTLGKLLCVSAMNEGKQVTYLPSYGTEVRGGTAHCHVVISPERIFDPLVETADSLIILNYPSFERFRHILRPGGVAVLNASLVDPGEYAAHQQVTVVPIRATELAAEMGNVLVANVLLLGAFLEATELCRRESVELALRQFLTGPKSRDMELNLAALHRGSRLAAETLQPGR